MQPRQYDHELEKEKLISASEHLNKAQGLQFLSTYTIGLWWMNESVEITFDNQSIKIPPINSVEAVLIFKKTLKNAKRSTFSEALWERSKLVQSFYLENKVTKNGSENIKCLGMPLDNFCYLLKTHSYQFSYQMLINNNYLRSLIPLLPTNILESIPENIFYCHCFDLTKNYIELNTNASYLLAVLSKFKNSSFTDINVLTAIQKRIDLLTAAHPINHIPYRVEETNTTVSIEKLISDLDNFLLNNPKPTAKIAENFIKTSSFGLWWIEQSILPFNLEIAIKIFRHVLKKPAQKGLLIALWATNTQLQHSFINDHPSTLLAKFKEILKSRCFYIITYIWGNSRTLEDTICHLSYEDATQLLECVLNSTNYVPLNDFVKAFIETFPHDRVIFNFIRNKPCDTDKKKVFHALLKKRWLERSENPVSPLFLELKTFRSQLSHLTTEEIIHKYLASITEIGKWWGNVDLLGTHSEKFFAVTSFLAFFWDVYAKQPMVITHLWRTNCFLRETLLLHSDSDFKLKFFIKMLEVKCSFIIHDLWNNSSHLSHLIQEISEQNALYVLNLVILYSIDKSDTTHFLQSFLAVFNDRIALQEVLINLKKAPDLYATYIELLENRLAVIDHFTIFDAIDICKEFEQKSLSSAKSSTLFSQGYVKNELKKVDEEEEVSEDSKKQVAQAASDYNVTIFNG